MDNVLIECVPNISEGRNLEIINSIVESAKQVKGVKVLGCEPDSDYNRTCLLYTSPSPRDLSTSRMPSSA